MASTDYKNKARLKQTKGDFLLQIDLIDRTLYLSDKSVTYTNAYEGLVIDWGDFDTDRSPGAGLSSVGDVNIAIANQKLQFMVSATHGDKFSDLLNFYDIDFRPARVYQIFEGLTFGSDAEQIFEGEVRIRGFDVDEVRIQLVHEYNLDLVIPTKKINLVDFPNAPKETFGLALPIPVGEIGLTSNPGVVSPIILTDRNTLRFDISAYEMNDIAIFLGAAVVVRWVDELNTFMTLTATNQTTSNTATGAHIELNDPVTGNIVIDPKLEGTKNDADDWKNATDGLSTTVCPLDGDDGANNELSLKIGSIPNLGMIQEWTSSNIKISISVENVVGAAGNAIDINYFNEGYDAGVGAFSTGVTKTVADLAGGSATYSFGLDKSAHGIDGGQADQNSPWTWGELGSIELYIKALAGHSLDIKTVSLSVLGIEIVAPWAVRPRRTRKVR